MNPRAAKRWVAGDPTVEAPATPVALDAAAAPVAVRLARAVAASLVHRVARGEGALLAIDLSILAVAALPAGVALASAAVCVLALTAMYAVNDLCDARDDLRNPKKDQEIVATYLEHRAAATMTCVALHLGTILLAATFDTRAALAAGSVMLANLVYSLRFKGVPVVDVAWCGLWGTLYAAIVTSDAQLLVTVGAMTAICHLYQTLDDLGSDAASGITTTAVRSRTLSIAVLAAACAALVLALRGPLGAGWALAVATPPLAFLLLGVRPLTGWLLTKGLFAAVWLVLLRLADAAG
jgi:4-hydroxybenzoate polyprenyltransferase